MKSVIRWAVSNSPAMNTLMLGVLACGALSLSLLRREVFPEFDLEIVLVSVPYPGASPSDVEEGICQKIEEACRSIDGIKKMTSIAQEGSGFVVIELQADVANVQRALNEIRSEVDRIPSFPDLAEDPEVKQISIREPAIRVGILGPKDLTEDAELTLRSMAEEVREQLLAHKTISQVSLMGVRDYQIDIEISEETLRKHGMTLQQVAQIVRRWNIDLPGGSMKTQSQEVLLRGKTKELIGEEIAKIPLVTDIDGVVLTIDDLGLVRDEFTDETSINEVDGLPAVVIDVQSARNEDLLLIVETVKKYVAEKAGTIPQGFELRTWQDRSVDVRDRMELLTRNGIQGLALVFLVLAIFLDLRLAFWVALGIPIAVLGAGGVLLFTGQTLNMLSMFAFLLALGIVVDDAIVIGENIHTHIQRGKPTFTAAVDGAYEVLPAVVASVSTTIIAFAPLLYVSGVMGKFIAVMPVAVIAMLVISLVESIFILPCHLSHRDNLFFTVIGRMFGFLWFIPEMFKHINIFAQKWSDWFVQKIYLPSLRWTLKNPALVVCSSIALLIITYGFKEAGITPWNLMPEMDSNWIHAKITYTDGTPSFVTDEATKKLEAAIQKVNAEHLKERGKPLLHLIHRSVGSVRGSGPIGPDSRSTGSHVGIIEVELVDTSRREITSSEILGRWRAATGDQLSGADSVQYGTPEFGPGGTPIEFKLVSDKEHMDQLEAATEECKKHLAGEKGVYDVRDDSRPGKWEFQLAIKKNANSMGVTSADLAETVRASYYGEEVMRLQRGRHEVKLMVRYPREQRKSFADFEQIRIRTNDGFERPVTELAQIDVSRGYSEINRIDQKRSITVSADVDEAVAVSDKIVQGMKGDFLHSLVAKYPDVDVRWEGQQEQSRESLDSLKVGFLGAVVAMFVLLTLVFRSYLQPLIILAIIPFGAMGAVWGHALLGLPLSLFSVFGIVALTGVVVNDSIVLIDYINQLVRSGVPLEAALLQAGAQRFRPVMLTSVTTVAGLLPMLTETSFQAQILIPMATSLTFGLIMGTVLVLILVPTFYLYYGQLALSNILDRAAEPDSIDPKGIYAEPQFE
ncbi:MAG: HAE1 family hydrophobic/amphiphilic exporter-1 [Pirellulaceae bacterium]|jgi:HAE1 family hydrophobic/amphiphilic exporter-1